MTNKSLNIDWCLSHYSKESYHDENINLIVLNGIRKYHLSVPLHNAICVDKNKL